IEPAHCLHTECNEVTITSRAIAAVGRQGSREQALNKNGDLAGGVTMMTVTRRGVLELAGAAGLGAVLASLPGAAAGDEKGSPPPKEEFLIVGPYALGDLF